MASGLKGKLTVTIHRAKDLKNVQLIGKQDPYVILTLGQEKFTTRVIKGGGTDAEWEQSFLFNLTGVEDALHLKINDQETTLDRPIGRLDIPLQDLVTKALKKQHTFQVYDVSNFSKLAGIISISSEFEGTGLIASSTSSTSTSTPTPKPAPTQATTQAQAPIQPKPVQQQQQFQQPGYPQQQAPQPVYQQPPVQVYQQQAPQPVYQQQPPVYQQPPVVYTQPPLQPQVVYGQPPVVQPVVYAQPQVVYGQPPAAVVYGQPQPQVIYGQPQPQARYF